MLHQYRLSFRRAYLCSHRSGGLLPSAVLFGSTPLIALVLLTSPGGLGRVVKVSLSLRFHLLGDSCYVGNDGGGFSNFNAKNSYSPFFDQVRDQLRDRELYTTLLDDGRLPLPLPARSNRSFW